MRLKRVLFVAVMVASVGFTLSLGGCGDDEPTGQAYSYSGPGSVWSVTLNADDTFVITHAASPGSAVDMTVNGTFTRLTTGFLKLTVTSATGTDAPAAGEGAYALEVPGFAFMLRPIGGDDNLIPMIASGACPSADFNANWVITDKEDSASATDNTKDFFGTFSYDHGATTAALPAKYSLAAPTATLGAGTVTGLGTCSNSVLTFDDGEMWLTEQGGAIVHAGASGTSDNTILAMSASAITSAANLAGDYAVLVFNKGEVSGDPGRMFPAHVTTTSSSATSLVMRGVEVTDVEAGTEGSEAITITLDNVDSPSAGFIRGTVVPEAGGGTGNIVCMGAANVVSSGKNVLFCIGQSPGGDQTKQFSLLMVSK